MAQTSNGPSRRSTSGSTSHTHSSPSHSHENVALPFHWHDKHNSPTAPSHGFSELSNLNAIIYKELMLRELEEARARATQMEKTMRWWSDCTANWREKWSKVRSERNKAREEVRLLRCKLEALQRETGILRREKNELENQLSQYGIPKLHRHKSENEVNSNHNKEALLYPGSDSPERDNSAPVKKENPLLSPGQSHLLVDGGREPNLHFLEQMFGCHSIEEMAKEMEDTSLHSHSRAEDIKSSRGRSCKEAKGGPPLADEYLRQSAEKENHHPHSFPLKDDSRTDRLTSSRENDVDKFSARASGGWAADSTDPPSQQTRYDGLPSVGGGNGSGNSSSQPSPSHRTSAMSDPLPEACHVSPRISAISDPLSEMCGTSECSETGYAESIRSSECLTAGPSRRWRGGGIGGSALDDSGITAEQESLEQQVTMLKLRLEEATKTVQAEREEKNLLDRENSRWQAEVTELRTRLEDVRASRQEAVKELVSLRALYQKEVRTLQLEMLDEASSRECIDRRMADLRGELERLQEENAAEWGKRERLESEKLGLERENKKLRSQIADLEGRLDKRIKMAVATADVDVGNLKEELNDKNKELSELKHAHAKLKKVLGDKATELQHCNRRADQYEGEVKRLRSRVDELKKELAASEDEVDGASNNIRKLQRSNDELQETVENLQVQVEHLQSRLRNSAHSLPLLSSSLLRRDSDDEPPEFLT